MKKILARRRFIALSAIAACVVGAVVFGGWRSTSSQSTLDREHNNEGATGMGSTTIALSGVELGVPAGWDSESFINPSGLSVFRLGSFFFQHRPDDDVGQMAQAAMGPNDVLINIVDFTATNPSKSKSNYRPVTVPLTVEGSDAIQQEGYTSPAAIIQSARINGHYLHVSVAFGSAPPSRAQVAAANKVLTTLTAS